MGRHARSKNAMSGGHFAGQGPDPYSRASAGDYHDRLAKKRRRGFALRTLLIALVVLLAGSGVAVAAWVGNIQSRMNNSEVVTTELREALTERDAPNDPYYVLLLGTDGRPGETQYRSDTIILARIDPQQKVATLLSIPRDTMVTWKGSTMMEQTMTPLPATSRMTSISISFQPSMDCSTRTSVSGDRARPCSQMRSRSSWS